MPLHPTPHKKPMRMSAHTSPIGTGFGSGVPAYSGEDIPTAVMNASNL